MKSTNPAKEITFEQAQNRCPKLHEMMEEMGLKKVLIKKLSRGFRVVMGGITGRINYKIN